MNAPVPARAHANMSVAERELSFDALLAEFGEDVGDDVETPSQPQVRARPQVPDAAAVRPAPPATPEASPSAAPGSVPAATPARTRIRASDARRFLTNLPPEVLKLSGLIVVAALSLTLVFIALAR